MLPLRWRRGLQLRRVSGFQRAVSGTGEEASGLSSTEPQSERRWQSPGGCAFPRQPLAPDGDPRGDCVRSTWASAPAAAPRQQDVAAVRPWANCAQRPPRFSAVSWWAGGDLPPRVLMSQDLIRQSHRGPARWGEVPGRGHRSHLDWTALPTCPALCRTGASGAWGLALPLPRGAQHTHSHHGTSGCFQNQLSQHPSRSGPPVLCSCIRCA